MSFLHYVALMQLLQWVCLCVKKRERATESVKRRHVEELEDVCLCVGGRGEADRRGTKICIFAARLVDKKVHRQR